MNLIRLYCFFILQAIFSDASGQIQRGQLCLNEFPVDFRRIVAGDSINLKELRVITNVLSNEFLVELEGVELDNRKKAFRRHIQFLSEKVESVYFQKTPLKLEVYESLFELLIFYKAYILSSEMNNSGIRFRDKFGMIWNTFRSNQKLKFTRTENVFFQEPKDSPFWHNSDSMPLHKRFGELADIKKVKRKNTMVVLFDEISESGSAPKIKTSDLDFDNEWMLKWGDEVHTDIVGSRIFAALGFDVDHPYFYGEDELILVFDKPGFVESKDELIDALKSQYEFDLSPYISENGLITIQMANKTKDLVEYVGMSYCTFKKCAIEARPDRVKRIGPFMVDGLLLEKRIEIRGALLAHAFIDNWDTRARNTLISTVHNGDHTYRISAVYSDLGTSFGVNISPVFGDFKVGLVNEFEWNLAELKRDKVTLNFQMNEISTPYKSATYADLYWMATKIAELDSLTLRKIIAKSGWPNPIAELYFHKLASRRASILKAFGIFDKHPISFNSNLTIVENGVKVIDQGALKVDYNRVNNPESFTENKGRFRNYGN